MRDHYGVYYSENKTDQFLGATLQVSDDVILVKSCELIKLFESNASNLVYENLFHRPVHPTIAT